MSGSAAGPAPEGGSAPRGARRAVVTLLGLLVLLGGAGVAVAATTRAPADREVGDAVVVTPAPTPLPAVPTGPAAPTGPQPAPSTTLGDDGDGDDGDDDDGEVVVPPAPTGDDDADDHGDGDDGPDDGPDDGDDG